MVYVDAIEVLSESDPRMQQSNLFTLSHRKDGFSYYSINVRESDSGDIRFIEDSLTRQGIPANIYPDRLKDEVVVIRFDNKGHKVRKTCPYFELLHLSDQAPLNSREMSGDALIVELILNEWDNQIRNGNVYSLSQFMKPDKE